MRCPQPVPRDQFTIIRDPQPVYQFQDYFIVSCKTGYNLMEVRSLLYSLQLYLGFSSVCVSLWSFSKTFLWGFMHGNLLQFLLLPCFCWLSSSGLSFPSFLPHAVIVSQSPGRRWETKIPWNIGKQEYLFGRIWIQTWSSRCYLPPLPSYCQDWVALVTLSLLMAADTLACYEEFVACGKCRIEGRQPREKTATATDCRGATIGQKWKNGQIE